jgi:hypothetical protein
MKNVIRFFFLLILVFTFSCEETGLFVNCSDCVFDEPLKANLEIKIQPVYPAINLVKVFEGNLEDNILFGTYQANSGTLNIWVPLNKKYTLTATYSISGPKYIAVDSATPGVKYTKNECDDPCYFVYDRFIDLRLKSY